MNDNRSLCTSVGRSFHILWFTVQFLYFEIKKFQDIASQNRLLRRQPQWKITSSAQIADRKQHRYMKETASLHSCHTKLLTFSHLTVPYLTGTNDHKQDRTTSTYAVTLAFAHANMHVRTQMYVHSHTTVTQSHSCAQTHSCAQQCICTCTCICTLMCEYKFMHIHTPHTPAGIYSQSRTHIYAVTCMHAHSSTNTCCAHSCTHSHPLTLVNAHSCTQTRACTHTRTHSHAHTLTCRHTRTHTHSHACTHTCAWTHTHSYMHTHTLVHSHTFVHTHTFAHA